MSRQPNISEAIAAILGETYSREKDERQIAAAERVANREPEDDGEGCRHHWVHRGTAPDGTVFYRCSKCKLESE